MELGVTRIGIRAGVTG